MLMLTFVPKYDAENNETGYYKSKNSYYQRNEHVEPLNCY